MLTTPSHFECLIETLIFYGRLSKLGQFTSLAVRWNGSKLDSLRLHVSGSFFLLFGCRDFKPARRNFLLGKDYSFPPFLFTLHNIRDKQSTHSST